MHIAIEQSTTPPLARQAYEVVERKGLGHPDSICDAVMDAVSVALCKEYLRVAGAILHHNLDKSLLIAGQATKTCGGGEILHPMELVMGDRATNQFHNTAIPVQEIAIAAAKQWFRDHLPHLNPEKHIRFRPVMTPGSAELTDIFVRGGAVLVANDTSAAAGHGPYTPLERLVLDLETYLNGPEFKTHFPDTGQDVKLMARRIAQHVDLTIAMPFLAPAIPSVDRYFTRKAETLEAVRDFLSKQGSFVDIQTSLNSLDRRDRGEGGMYLSLTGTSAEDADSGQVGRGNRVSGVIAFHRPAGAEAAAGKNPVSHVGKIYNVLAHCLAQDIATTIADIEAVSVWLVSRIGRPIDHPALIQVQITPSGDHLSTSTKNTIEAFIRERFERITDFCQALAQGRHRIC